MLDLRTFLLNRLSVCECPGWCVEIGSHSPDCKQTAEREFIDRVTAIEAPSDGPLRAIEGGKADGASTAAATEERRESGVAG